MTTATRSHAPAARWAPPPLAPPLTRSPTDLLLDQLSGIDRCARPTAIDLTGHLSREQRMDLERLAQARDRERSAMRDWVQAQQCQALAPMQTGPVRAVVAHRQEWFRNKVVVALRDAGVHVCAELHDGADACGIALAEQPELLLLEDRLPSFSALDVVKRLSTHAPGTFIGIQVNDQQDIGELLGRGVRAVFTRVIPPADVARELTRSLVSA